MFTPKNLMFTVILYLLALLALDYGYAASIEEEHMGALKSTKGAMRYAVNKGDYRVNDNLSMDDARFAEAYQLLTKTNSRSKYTAYQYTVQEIGDRYAAVSAESFTESSVMNFYPEDKRTTIKRKKNMIYIWDDLNPVK
ncbi:hypothetical protein ABHN11_24510 [Brevibacillus centrosporus]|uniref:hypothetical protein n=1 Tax=Brevibacillus centrosporus TaxID=54910 RepID=UPI003D1B01DF